MMPTFKPSKIKLISIIGLMAVISSLWLIPGPDRVGAMISITPNGEQVQQGYEWQADILMHSNVKVNALDLAVVYPADEVQVIETSVADSRFATPIFKPVVESSKHEVYFVQATLEPFDGKDGKVGTITFKAKRPAKPNITVNIDSKIIAHDGDGTNVFREQLSRSVGSWLVDVLKGEK